MRQASTRRYHLRANVHNMGDVSIESGSIDMDVTVYRSPQLVGHYDQLIHIEAPTDEDWTGNSAYGGFRPDAKWTIYRTDNEASLPDWADLDAVKTCLGMADDYDLAHMFTSAVDGDRAIAWQAIASYYGWAELDSYPLEFGYAEAIRYVRRHIVTYSATTA